MYKDDEPQEWYDLDAYRGWCVPDITNFPETCTEWATEEQDRLWKEALHCGNWNAHDTKQVFLVGTLDVMLEGGSDPVQSTMCAAQYLYYRQGVEACKIYKRSAYHAYIAHRWYLADEDLDSATLSQWAEDQMQNKFGNFDAGVECPNQKAAVLANFGHVAGDPGKDQFLYHP